MKVAIKVLFIFLIMNGVSYGFVVDGKSIVPGSELVTGAIEAAQIALDVVSENIANQYTTRDKNGTAYKAKEVNFEGMNVTEVDGVVRTGVQVTGITRDVAAGTRLYSSSHPHADAEGYVEQSNVDLSKEMVNMMKYSRWMEAEYAVANTSVKMVQNALMLGR